MRTHRSLRRCRRGLTLTEVLISGFLMLGIVFVLTQFSRLNNIMWQRGVADSSAQKEAQQAVQKIAPFIRKARRVVTSQSNRVVLQLPTYDVDGNLVIPQTDGDQVSFYLSDASGDPGQTGKILWRATNGTPDTDWSMSGSKGRVLLDSLTFTYSPVADPESVTLNMTASKQVGTSTQQFMTSQEVTLRNKLD